MLFSKRMTAMFALGLLVPCAGAVAQMPAMVKLSARRSAHAPLAGLLADRFSADTALRNAAQRELAKRSADPPSRAAAWQAYRAAPTQQAMRQEWENKVVTTPERSSPYLWRHVGTKPADGWALVIAMHGGGNAPKEVNDREWQHMFQAYYKEHPEAGGYVYLALRAPNDTWNGFYDDAICPLVERLIQQFVLFDAVNPDKVIPLGASHGGYGAFVIGPKIPYRFAAIHAAASAPTDGETRGENLRDVPFSITTGALDNGFGRIDRDRKFMTQIEGWRAKYGGYNVTLTAPEGVGHLVPDHDELALLLKYKRDAAPQKVVWTQSDTVLKRFYWLEAFAPVNEGHIEASIVGNIITLKADKQDKVALWLDAPLVNLQKPVTINVVGGKSQTLARKPTLETYCLGLEQTADPHLAAPVRVEVSLRP